MTSFYDAERLFVKEDMLRQQRSGFELDEGLLLYPVWRTYWSRILHKSTDIPDIPAIIQLFLHDLSANRSNYLSGRLMDQSVSELPKCASPVYSVAGSEFSCSSVERFVHRPGGAYWPCGEDSPRSNLVMMGCCV